TKPFNGVFAEVAFISDLGFLVSLIYKSGALKQRGNTQRITHRWNQHYYSQKHQVPHPGSGNQPGNPRPEWFAIDFEIVEKPVCFSKIQHACNKRATPWTQQA